jgi:prephenate dehydrogenase
VRWRKAAILGIGLLGGSLGLALRQRKLADEVAGFARREETARDARAAGACDSAGTCLEAVLRDADLVVFCTPLSQMAALGESLSGWLAPGALVTDVGSVKQGVVGVLERLVSGAGGQFVGSHPMAGGERSGVGAARPDLFQGAVSIVTPTEQSAPEAVTRVSRLWESVGARALLMTPERHDHIVSRTSHLPHLAAAALARCVLGQGRPAEQGELCASGFRDTTRVASGSPTMWRDIALENRAEILAALDEFEQSLEDLRRALELEDGNAVERFLREAKERRDAWRGGHGNGANGE